MDSPVSLRHVETGLTFMTGMEFSTPVSDEEQLSLSRCGLVALRSASRGTSMYFTTEVPEHGTDVASSACATVREDMIALALLSAKKVRGFTAVHARIELHDFGLGTAVVTWEPEQPCDLATARDPDVVAALSAAARDVVQPLLDESMRGLRAAVTSPPRPDGVVSLLRSVESELPHFGEALWVWSHLRLSCADRDEHQTVAKAVAASVCPNDYQLLVHRDHSYATGVSVSVTCSVDDKFDDGIALSRALPRQDAWWALVWCLDRSLLSLQHNVHHAAASESLEAMAARARQIRTVTVGIQFLRSRIDSILANAGARELAVWTCLGESWHLDRRVEIAQRKLAFLHDNYEGVIAETSRRRADQVSFMVYVFTAVSVIASAIAVIQYAQGSASSGFAYRAAVLVVCVMAASGAVLTSLRAKKLRTRSTLVSTPAWSSLVRTCQRHMARLRTKATSTPSSS